jgi:signal transduction histidine kinase
MTDPITPATVLIVDDTPENLTLLQKVLKDGYIIRVATSGIQALEVVRSHPVDIILLDIMMPEMDGLETCRRLKEDPLTRDIPVIFVTSLGEVDYEIKGFALGAVDFITKPIRVPVVRARVKTHLALFDQNRALANLVQERTAELTAKQSQLEAINLSLQQRVDETVAELRQRDKAMISQSRQAAMGEMIGNIAHQWRQPLNALAVLLVNIQQAEQYNELTADYLADCVKDGSKLIQKMSTTINDFSNFFIPDKEALLFSAIDQINSAVSLLRAAFAHQNISIALEIDNDLMLTGFPNEYSQVLLNLLSNAKDAIKGCDGVEGKVFIRLYEHEGFGCVSVSDNGGGIDPEVIDKIFEPYFSTKNMGTGIGLYMSKMILEKSMNGTIEAYNIEGGAEFTVRTPLTRKFTEDRLITPI